MKLNSAYVLLIVLFVADLGQSDVNAAEVSQARQVPLGMIPNDAAIVFIRQRGSSIESSSRNVYVATEDGNNITQLTFNSGPKYYEHAAVSPDRKKVIVNYWIRDPSGDRRSLLWILDLDKQTEAQLVPDFHSAGDGGIDWDRDGFIYFAAVPKKPQPDTFPESDLYRIKYDGTNLQRLTNTSGLEKDVSVSEDGTMLAYVKAVPTPPRGHTEIWISRTDGKEARLAYKSGAIGVNSAHDPELSPDNKAVVFSLVNPNHKNFSDTHNTAHDVYVLHLDGARLTQLTSPGGIQIVPDWHGDRLVYTDLNEADGYMGIAVIDSDGDGRRRIGPTGARMPKWIP